ncbi:hypothetical protein LRR81_19775 [Metabacillus sp. GX 13764]|uniref:hypothetical protein n=1 Tax=Metabacillus kandeliae TaxID=2900151 RepID=UPI001E542831|nr:hypothetical protein [Metabacillus kandeliae]MCD7036491.1 hypothetical protein [Metabacillus kandeliae]
MQSLKRGCFFVELRLKLGEFTINNHFFPLLVLFKEKREKSAVHAGEIPLLYAGFGFLFAAFRILYAGFGNLHAGFEILFAGSAAYMQLEKIPCRI